MPLGKHTQLVEAYYLCYFILFRHNSRASIYGLYVPVATRWFWHNNFGAINNPAYTFHFLTTNINMEGGTSSILCFSSSSHAYSVVLNTDVLCLLMLNYYRRRCLLSFRFMLPDHHSKAATQEIASDTSTRNKFRQSAQHECFNLGVRSILKLTWRCLTVKNFPDANLKFE